MRDNDASNDTLPAILAFVAGLSILAVAIAAFVIFVDDGGTSTAQGASASGRRPNCLKVNECRAATPEFAAAYNDPRACDGTEKRVCLVPLGEVPKDLVDHLVAYYRTEYDLGVRVLPTVSLEGLTWNRPGQMEAHYLESLYAKAYPLLYRDRNVILIGLTSLDIYTADQNWNWFFGHSGSGKALFSLYRMDPVNWGKRVNDDLRNKRVRTLMNKYVGLNYYNLPLSDNPRNVMYRLIGGLDTLDGIDERIPLRILPTPRPGTTIGTPLPTPTAIPQRLESIGRLIAMEYIEAIESTKAVVAIRGNTADIEDKLTQLRDSYKPSLAKLGCETDAMSVEERIGVFEAAVAYHDIHGNEDFDWFTEAVGSFGDDSGVGKLLHELNTISHYAMPNAYGEPRAFKTPCD